MSQQCREGNMMIWYNNIDAVNAIRQGVKEDYRNDRRGLRLVITTDHSAGAHSVGA